jgi:hypothetical protein
MLLMAVAGLMAVAAVVLAVLLAAQPDVPRTLPALPALAFLYLQLLRAVAERKQPPTDLKGKPIKVRVSRVPAHAHISVRARVLPALMRCHHAGQPTLRVRWRRPASSSP